MRVMLLIALRVANIFFRKLLMQNNFIPLCISLAADVTRLVPSMGI